MSHDDDEEELAAPFKFRKVSSFSLSLAAANVASSIRNENTTATV